MLAVVADMALAISGFRFAMRNIFVQSCDASIALCHRSSIIIMFAAEAGGKGVCEPCATP